MKQAIHRAVCGACLVFAVSEWAQGTPLPEVNRTVQVYDREERFSVDPAFQMPPGNPSEWAWRLTAVTTEKWKHIPGTQVQEGGDGWDAVDFSGRTGYWRMLVTSARSDSWRHFQNIMFGGDLRPVGPGPGSTPYIGSFEIDAETEQDYFMDPDYAIAEIGSPITITAREPGRPSPDPEVRSTWEIAPAHDGIIPPPEEWPPGTSIQFTSIDPGAYIVTGRHENNPDLFAMTEVVFTHQPTLVTGRIPINPNQAPDFSFFVELPDGTRITFTDLQTGDLPGYEGPAIHLRIRPRGPSVSGLEVNGAPYLLHPNVTYEIHCPEMTVQIANDNINPQGRAVGQWWVEIHAPDAILSTDAD